MLRRCVASTARLQFAAALCVAGRRSHGTSSADGKSGDGSSPKTTGASSTPPVPQTHSSTSSGSPSSSSVTTANDYSGAIPGATGKDNRPGLYSTPNEEPYFVKAFPNNADKEIPSHDRSFGPREPKNRSDNLQVPEFNTVFGSYENAPGWTGGPSSHRYQQYVRKPSDTEGVAWKDVVPQGAIVGHHPHFDYTNKTGKKEGNISNTVNTWVNWEIQGAKMSLYRACLKAIPLVKHFYLLNNPLDRLKDQVRRRFLMNKNVKDPDAIRHLLQTGWMEYQECVLMRRTRTSLQRFFPEDANYEHNLEYYAEQEGKNLQERRFWNGEEQRREGPYDGHWSAIGKETEEEFRRIANRVPMGWTTAKGYFEKFKADGTNFWEKNLDYEGWYLRNVNPDEASARKDQQAWVQSGYNQPRHYASKNRRGYRRLVKDIESVMESSLEDTYTKNREQMFQYLIREQHSESNRVNAERQLALMDDSFYTCNMTELEQYVKQCMREMPNPRLWKTDAFYYRLRYLASSLEFNWARVPVGAQQEKLFREWISDTVNYAVYNSKTFQAIKRDKKRNPMANSFADFYAQFDPDVPETRRLPWYHPEFNYDRRYKWDERCMRMKKWVQSGTIDGKHDYFASLVAEWEQYINRPERAKALDDTERRHSSPKMVQLFRALGNVMDVALANQIKEHLLQKSSGANLGQCSVEDVQKKLDALDWSTFTFKVPVIIYPDGVAQQSLGLDGSPIAQVQAAA